VKRTLKRELKVLEIVKREANEIGKNFVLIEYNKQEIVYVYTFNTYH